MTHEEAMAIVDSTKFRTPVTLAVVRAWAYHVKNHRGIPAPEPHQVCGRMRSARPGSNEWEMLAPLLSTDLAEPERDAVAWAVDTRKRGLPAFVHDPRLRRLDEVWQREVLDQIPAPPDPERHRLFYGGKVPFTVTAHGLRRTDDPPPAPPEDPPSAS